MKYFRWNVAKNRRLRGERGVSFEENVIAIGEGGLLNVLEHRNQSRKAPRDYLRISGV